MIDPSYLFGTLVLTVEIGGAVILILIGNLQGARDRAAWQARLHADMAAQEYSERRRLAERLAGYERTDGMARVEAAYDLCDRAIALRVRFAGGMTLGCEVPIHMLRELRERRDARYAVRHAAGMVAEAVMNKIEPEIARAIGGVMR